MGVPKFFRYMSERYPTLSQLVQEFEIPEFDNLYLDMNGIIHPCSHPNDFDPHFRITEKCIFEAIFHYIEFLFKTIKPQKLFFLAVDGVAPRAKMNQQRGRRFRSAKEAEVLEALAKKNGEVLPSEKRFDSNCITPGTVFMDNLHKQLEYFITMKISTDPSWQKCQIILSGHNTPGEGEHKIMDYIRYLKSQPNYDSNTRHCLYGLDADLIMLGMCTHDPNFCLLREEVKFTRSKAKRIMTPEETNFYLLHLSLLRDYLDIEFQELKQKLPFPYNLESIIDDWVLMGFLIGNDFIPHLPDLHVNTGAFPALFQAYKEILPTLDGYLNEKGQLNLKRFQTYITRVAKADYERFEQKFADIAYLEQKVTKGPVDIRTQMSEKSKKTALEELIAETEEMFLYESDSDCDEEEDRKIMMKEFGQHKRDYYINKLEYDDVTEEVLKSQAEGYIRAIQWILHYYYHGCRSWSWFYPHHYSPFVSDVAKYSDFDLKFDMGKPFLPFHQLLAVLPPASKDLLPETYQPLMTDENSPIKDFYPEDFATDLNGKIQEWEAVVLIPFIDENRLLKAMDLTKDELSEDEVRRNSHGPIKLFSYTRKNFGLYQSSLFPDVVENHAAVKIIWPHDLAVDLSKLCYEPGHGYDKNLYIPGFSTLRFLPHFGKLGAKAGIRVFDRAATGDSILITITQQCETDIKAVAKKLIGQTVFVGWPHMVQARVTSLCCKKLRIHQHPSGRIEVFDQTDRESTAWSCIASDLTHALRDKRGIIIDDVLITVNVKRAEGKLITVLDNDVKIENCWSKTETPFALQTIVKDIKTLQLTDTVPKTLEEAYPIGSKVIVLAEPHFGKVGRVLETVSKRGISLAVTTTSDPIVYVENLLDCSINEHYMPAGAACRRISLNMSVFNRITGLCFMKAGDKRVNVGLNLKYNKTNQEVPGYTKKDNNAWLYSEKAVELVGNYWDAFPEIFEYLNSINGSDFSLDEIYEAGSGKDREILKWIQEQPHAAIAPVNCGSILINSQSVFELESTIESFHKQSTEIVVHVKPSDLYKSDLVLGNVSPINCSNELLDRVVCCRYSHTVPFGLKGYIIGIYPKIEEKSQTFDVLFDEAFQGGQAILGAKKPRVCVMSTSVFVNITAHLRENRPTKMPKQQTLSAFAPVNQTQGSNAIAANGNSIRPAKDAKFSNMWREMQQPADALKRALNINSEPPKTSTSAPCVALMAQFERSPLGVPKYEYFTEGNTYTATVTLPNGLVFVGLPFPSKKDAAEFAALQALAGINAKGIMKPQVPMMSPQKNTFFPQQPPFMPQPRPPPLMDLVHAEQRFNFPKKLNVGPPMPPNNWREQKQTQCFRPQTMPSSSSSQLFSKMPFIPLQAIRPISKFDRRRPVEKISTTTAPVQMQMKTERCVKPQPPAPVPPTTTVQTEKPIRKKRQIAARFDNVS